MLGVGVKVAVKTSGSAVATRSVSVPLSALRSLSVKPVGASLKVMVSVLISPAIRVLSANVMVAVRGVTIAPVTMMVNVVVLDTPVAGSVTV